MKALSIRQPWAWLIVHGHKDIENRTWATSFRGRFLVHAAQSFDHGGYRWVQSKMRVPMPEPSRFERGGIVGEADLVHCVSRHKSRWFSGPRGFVLANARPLPFRPLRGRQRFFKVEDDDESVVEPERKVGVVVRFDAARRRMLVRLVDWLRVGDPVRVREQRKDDNGHPIQNPQELRLKFRMKVKKIHLGAKSFGGAFPKQIVWVYGVPPVRKADEPKEGDCVFRVWCQNEPLSPDGPPSPGGPVRRPKPPAHPPSHPNPPSNEPPIEPPEDDDEEEPDLPDPDDIDKNGKRRKGRGVGG
jgi:hypothetical protein